MHNTPEFHTDTLFGQSLVAMFQRLEHRLQLNRSVAAYLAGGAAVHLYTGSRATVDIDVEYSARIILPDDIITTITGDNGRPYSLHFDATYNPMLGIMHENYQEDALPLDFGLKMLDLHILTPVDLVVSKIARLADNDKQDIYDLVRAGLTTAAEIEQRALPAINACIGNKTEINMNLRDALAIAQSAEPE